MQIHELSLTDTHRLIIGDVTWSFAPDVVLRAVFVYLLLLFFMRLMGKRLAAGLSITELAVILTLGAAAGLPLQSAKQGLLPAAVVLFVGLVFQRGLSRLSFRSRWLEIMSLGDVMVLVQEGRLLIDKLHATQLSNAKLFAALRSQGILHLGQLRRVYLEASGQFSVILYREQRPGLAIMPTAEVEFVGLKRLPDRELCLRCGYCPDDKEPLPATCPHCRGAERDKAVLQDDGARSRGPKMPPGSSTNAGGGPL